MAFRAIDNAAFVSGNRNNSVFFDQQTIGLNKNFCTQAWNDTGFVTYLDAIAFAAGQVSAWTNVPGNVNLTAADSGKIIQVGTLGASAAINLPAPAFGLRFRVYISGPPTGGFFVTINTTGGSFEVNQWQAGGAGQGNSGNTHITQSGNVANSKVGDQVDLWCDGTLWHARVFTQVLAGFTYS